LSVPLVVAIEEAEGRPLLLALLLLRELLSMAPVEKLKRLVLLTTRGTEPDPDPVEATAVAVLLSLRLVSPTEEPKPKLLQEDDPWGDGWGLRLRRLRLTWLLLLRFLSLSLLPSMTASTKALPGEYSDLLPLRLRLLGGVWKAPVEKEEGRRGEDEAEGEGEEEVLEWVGDEGGWICRSRTVSERWWEARAKGEALAPEEQRGGVAAVARPEVEAGASEERDNRELEEPNGAEDVSWRCAWSCGEAEVGGGRMIFPVAGQVSSLRMRGGSCSLRSSMRSLSMSAW
jgi:hypothetical protein